MIKTIKVTEQLTLLELLQKFDVGEVSEGRYFSENYPNRGVELAFLGGVSFLNKGGFSTRYSSGYLDDIYEVNVEEEVTEDTVFHKLVEIYDKSCIVTYRFKSIKEVKGHNTKSIYAVIDDKLQLVWEC